MSVFGYAQLASSDSLHDARDLYRDSVDEKFEKAEFAKLKQPHFEAETEYMSLVNYRGRNFGINQYGISPQLFYKLGNGLYFNLTEYYWSGMPHPFAKTDVGIGYEKDITDRLYFSVAYEHWYFNNGTKSERQELQHFFELDFSYDFDWFNVEVATYYMRGTEEIFQNTFTLSKNVMLKKFAPNFYFELNPTIYSIYSDNSYALVNAGGAIRNPQKEHTGYALIDYEAALPLTLRYGNLSVVPCFKYAFPVPQASDSNDPLKSFGYGVVTLHYNFIQTAPIRYYGK